MLAIWIYINAKSRNIKTALWWAIGSFMIGIFGPLLYYLLVLRPDKKGLDNEQLILQGSETVTPYPKANQADTNNHIFQAQPPSPFQENSQIIDQKKPKDIKKTVFLALFCFVLVVVGLLMLISGIKQFNGSKVIENTQIMTKTDEVCDKNGYCIKPNPDIKYAKDGVLEIEERGIKIILADEVKDAMYAVGPQNDNYSIVFSTQRLASVAKGCNLDILHILANDTYSVTDGDYYLVTFNDPDGTGLGAGYLKNLENYPSAVKINNTYYQIAKGHSSCMGSEYDEEVYKTILTGFENSTIVALD